MKEFKKLELSSRQIEKVIKHFFPSAHVLRIERKPKGVMNLVLEIEIENPKRVFIMKLSKQPKKFSMEKEKFVLEMVRKKTNVPVAEIIESDFSKKKFPFEIMIMSKIEGEMLSAIWDKLSKKEKIEIAKGLGEVLGELHKLKSEKFARIKGKKLKHFNSWKKMFFEDVKSIKLKIKKEKRIPENVKSKIFQLFKEHEKLFMQQKEPVLVHNDYHLDHLFAKKKGKAWDVTGIIDFGFAEFNPKECDFVKPHRWIFDKGKHIERAFIKGYKRKQRIKKDFKKLVLLYRLHYDLVFINRLLKVGNERVAKQYIENLPKLIKLAEKA